MESILIITNIVILYAALYSTVKNKKFYDISNIYFYSLSVFIVFPLFYINLLHKENNYYFIYSNWLDYTNLVCLVILLTSLISNILFDKINTPKVDWKISKNVMFTILAFLAISYASKFQLFISGSLIIEDKYAEVQNISSSVKYFSNFDIALFPIVAALFFDKKENNITIKAIFWVTLSIMIIYAVIQGRRFGIIYPLLITFIIHSIYNGIKTKKTILFISLSASVFFSMTAIRLSQAQAVVETGESISVMSAIKNIDDDILDNLTQSLISRIGNPYIMLNHVSYHKNELYREPFYNVATHAMTSVVPRIFYPEKKPISIGNEFGKEIGVISINNHITKINPGWPAEVSYSYGLIGVSLFFFFTIGMIKLAYQYFNVNNHIGIIVYASLFTFVFSGFQMEFAFAFNTLIKTIFVLFVICFIHKRES